MQAWFVFRKNKGLLIQPWSVPYSAGSILSTIRTCNERSDGMVFEPRRRPNPLVEYRYNGWSIASFDPPSQHSPAQPRSDVAARSSRCFSLQSLIISSNIFNHSWFHQTFLLGHFLNPKMPSFSILMNVFWNLCLRRDKTVDDDWFDEVPIFELR